MKMKHLMVSTAVAVGFGWLLSSCANSGGGAYPLPSVSAPSSPPDTGAPKRAKERTGIATGFGREVKSEIDYMNFVRSSAKPRHLTSIRYNDREGAQAMGVRRGRKGSGMQQAAGGLIEWGMSSSWGALDNYQWRGRRFVVGKKGREYDLRVKNRSVARVEVVLSVDGLDVIDGRAASVKKRGYLIEPGKTLLVKGFRTSDESVASFKFSSVTGSYANLKHGKTRNVGVVGLALFTEKGREPWVEAAQRGSARAFAESPNVQARD